ncbi:unnamed protein product, partial [Mesorhabditis spiculigera]
MSGGMYAGDEVGAIVFDAGSHSFRCGFAGEEFPTSDISSSIGVDEAVAMETDDTSITKRERKIYIGTTKNIVPRANCEIKNFMSDGMIEDWDLFEEMMNYAYKDALRTDSSDHPALFSESAWNDKAKREKLTELAFEKYNVPAYFLVNNAVLAAFANGRTSGLIVDSGATQTSAVPVFDGYAVKHAIVRCPLGGDMISEQIEKVLTEQKIDVVPTYRIKAKEEVNEGEPAKWTEKANLPAVTESYDKFMRKLLLQDMAASVLQLCDVPIDPESAEKLPSSPYAFPNGFHKEFLGERIKIPEGLFDLKYLRDVDTSSLMNVSHLAWSSCGMCDVDMRPSMYQNVLVTGGNSLILGFTERLSHDLSQKCPPSARIRLSAPPTSMERRFGPWIGGSILASVGTFQQMWISKTEYEESGRSIVDKKCP